MDNGGDTDIGALRAEFREFLEAQRAKEEQETEKDSRWRSEHYHEAAQLCARHDEFRKEQEEENCRLRDRACLQEERQAEESVLHTKICHAMQEEMSAERCLLRGEIQQVAAEAKEERERRVTSARLRGEREAEEAWQRREREKNAQLCRLEESRQQDSSQGAPPVHGELPLPAESRTVREPFSPLFQQEVYGVKRDGVQEQRRQQHQRSARLRGEWEAERKSLQAQLARLHEEQRQEGERSLLRSEVNQALAAQTLRTTLTQHREEEEQKWRQKSAQFKSEWDTEWRSLRGEWDAERSSLRAELGQLQEALLRQDECAEEELKWRRLVSRSPSPSRLHSSLSPVPAGMRRAAEQQAAQGEDLGFEPSLPSRTPWLPSIPQPFQGRWASGGDAAGSGNARRWQAERNLLLDEFHRAMDAQQLEASEMQRKEGAAEEQRRLKSARRKEEWASEWSSMKGEIFDLMKVHHEQTFQAIHRDEAHSHQQNAELEQERHCNRTGEEDFRDDLGEEEEEDQEEDVTMWAPGDTRVVVRTRSRPPALRHSDQRLSTVPARRREQDHAPLELQPWSQPRQKSRPRSGGTTRTAHQRLSERQIGLHRMDSLPPGLAEQVLEEQRKQLMREQWPTKAARPQRRARSVVQLRPATSSGSDHRVVAYGLQEPWSQGSKRRASEQAHIQHGLPCLQSSPMITQDRWGEGVRPRSAVPTRSR